MHGGLRLHSYHWDYDDDDDGFPQLETSSSYLNLLIEYARACTMQDNFPQTSNTE